MKELEEKLVSFRKKYYLKKVLLGFVSFLIVVLTLFYLFNWIEYTFWTNNIIRAILLFTYFGTFIYLLSFWIVLPFLKMIGKTSLIGDEEIAKEISKYFPDIDDKLLNIIQLSKSTIEGSTLRQAAINKKQKSLLPLKFQKAIDFKPVKKFGGVLSFIIGVFILLSFIQPEIISDGSYRIANYNTSFEKAAPFNFVIVNESLKSFTGDDFHLEFIIEGEEIPSEVYLVDDDTKNSIRVSDKGSGFYQYAFKRLLENKSFKLMAAGYYSKRYMIELNDRPELLAIDIEINYPDYTRKEKDNVGKTGNISVLEGSIVNWKLKTMFADSLIFKIEDQKVNSKKFENIFNVEKKIMEKSSYEINLSNEYASNKSEISFEIDVIKDQYPEISTEFYLDTIEYKYVTVGGKISDDYGFKSLESVFEMSSSKWKRNIPIKASSNYQSFYATFDLDSLNIREAESLSIEMFLKVIDNDAINGFKESKSRSFSIKIPSYSKLKEKTKAKAIALENQLDKNKELTTELNQNIEQLEQRLKTAKSMNWQEEKLINDLLKERENVEKEIKKLQNNFKELNNSKERFNEQSESLKKKNKQLEELIKELSDNKTMELYEKLKELLEKEKSNAEMQKAVNDIKNNEKNLERELDRAIELFKRLELESALEESMQNLDSLSKKQDNLSEKSDDLASQKEIGDKFEDFREQMEEIRNLNQKLKTPQPLTDFGLEERQIQKELNDIEKSFRDGKNEDISSQEKEGDQQKETDSNFSEREKESSQNSRKEKQKNAAQKMKELREKMANMRSGMSMEMMQANLDELRDIADNLIKLSFEQEKLLKEMRSVNQSDPRFIEISQEQLSLKGDAKVIQDSLLSLASRVTQISSFVTREVGEINSRIDLSIEHLKDRNRGKALSSQQFSMTSINNLALLLDNTMQQMQMSMAQSMGKSGDQKNDSPGLKELQEMQDQLGEDMKKLNGSGKEGRELSEELARLAAEQEMIRQQLEEFKEGKEGKPGGSGGSDNLINKAIQMMEQNEADLVNKRITRQLLNRQKLIETRLLEAEKSEREQSEDPEREGEIADQIKREFPPKIEEYIKLKQKEIELLKRVPLELNPFYQKEVNDYFRRISSEKSNDR